MALPRAMASLATDAALEEWRDGEAVLSPRDGLEPACVADEAALADRSGEMNEPVLLIAWRKIPLAGRRVVGHWSLEQESILRKQIASAYPPRSDEPLEQPLPFDARSRA